MEDEKEDNEAVPAQLNDSNEHKMNNEVAPSVSDAGINGGGEIEGGAANEAASLSETKSPMVNGSVTKTAAASSTLETEDQFVVHVDESDTNLDYDLGDKPEERDAPTPTKDESMDVDAADIVVSEANASGSTFACDQTAGTDKSNTVTADATAGSGSAGDLSSKRFVTLRCY